MTVEAGGTVDRSDVIAFRFHRHQLDRPADSADASDVDLLDYGVQDTGTDGHAWALAARGARPPGDDDLDLAWTLRGAPHAYRRHDVAGVAVATAPFSESDAASRVFDAAKPLRASGTAVLDALKTIASEMRDVVRQPTVKGDVSSALTERLPPAFLRACRPCNATHPYEQPFRLAALQAGLELDPGTSPPVLRPIAGLHASLYERLAADADPRLHAVRNYLRFFGPAPAKAIAAFLDAPVSEVTAHLPDDVASVAVAGFPAKPARYVLAEDLDALRGASERWCGRAVRLVGSHDPYLQLRDRDVLVEDEAQRKDLWRVLGRPGAILVAGEVVGTWRSRSARKAVTIQLEPWTRWDQPTRAAIAQEAERLALHRGVALGAIDGL